MSRSRLRPDAGIAIAAILFVIALLALIGSVIAAGSGSFSTASVTDRVQADIATQANLIRSKINECNLMYGTNSNYDGYPSSDATNGTLVSALTCTGDPSGMQSLWSGERPANLPPPSSGFNNWYYINTNGSGLGGSAAGGRCIWITPSVSSPSGNTGVVAGLSKAANKFSNGTSCSPSCPPEVVYDPASTSQKFVVWITLPTGTPNSNCLP
jgi:type II secretory pathway pseudopilin PulG